jgi:hypothetical protein
LCKTEARIIGVETNFLHGYLNEGVFMEIQTRMEASKDEYLI